MNYRILEISIDLISERYPLGQNWC